MENIPSSTLSINGAGFELFFTIIKTNYHEQRIYIEKRFA